MATLIMQNSTHVSESNSPLLSGPGGSDQKAFDMVIGGTGSLYIEYNDLWFDVGDIHVDIPARRSYHYMVWDKGSLEIDNTYTSGSYFDPMPGNYQVSFVEGEPVVPPDLSWYIEEIITD